MVLVSRGSSDTLGGMLDRFLAQWRVSDAMLVGGTRQGSRHGGRTVDAARLRFVLGGSARVRTNMGGSVLERDFSPAQPIFAGPGARVRLQWTGAATMACIILGADQTRIAGVEHSVSLTGEASDAIRHHTAPPLGAAGQSIVKALSELLGRAGSVLTGAHLVRALFELVRNEAFSAPGPTCGKARQSYLAMRDYVHEHCCEPISRSGVAAVFDVTPTHLSRLFKQQGRESFSQFLTRLRLEHAADLLSTTRLTVSEVAYQCGYSDPSYFIRVFRREHGVSPGRFSARSKRILCDH